jgi:hypothetical protein
VWIHLWVLYSVPLVSMSVFAGSTFNGGQNIVLQKDSSYGLGLQMLNTNRYSRTFLIAFSRTMLPTKHRLDPSKLAAVFVASLGWRPSDHPQIL